MKGDVETNSIEVILELLLAGHGVALMPTWLVGEYLRKGALTQVLTDYAAPDAQVFAVYPPGRHLSPRSAPSSTTWCSTSRPTRSGAKCSRRWGLPAKGALGKDGSLGLLDCRVAYGSSQ